jgi:hypothetical protein
LLRIEEKGNEAMKGSNEQGIGIVKQRQAALPAPELGASSQSRLSRVY